MTAHRGKVKRERPHGPVSERFMRKHYGASGFHAKGTTVDYDLRLLRDSMRRLLECPLSSEHGKVITASAAQFWEQDITKILIKLGQQ